MARKTDIKKKIDKFFELFDELKALAIQKRNETTEADRKVSNMYHNIEGTKFTHVSQSHKMMLELQRVLLDRRTLKRDDAMLRSMVDQMGSQMGSAKKSNTTIITKHDEIIEEIRVRAITGK